MVAHNAFEGRVDPGMAVGRGDADHAQARRVKTVAVFVIASHGLASDVGIAGQACGFRLARADLRYADGVKTVVGEESTRMAGAAFGLTEEQKRPALRGGVQCRAIAGKVLVPRAIRGAKLELDEGRKRLSDVGDLRCAFHDAFHPHQLILITY